MMQVLPSALILFFHEKYESSGLNCMMAYKLITRDLQEILGLDLLAAKTSLNGLRACWSVVPVGKIHIGYLVQMRKLADCLHAGIHVTVLIEDNTQQACDDIDNEHTATEPMDAEPMDNEHTATAGATAGAAYYSAVIRDMLRLYATADMVATVDFVLSSSLGADYMADLYRAAVYVPSALPAGIGTIRRTRSVLYPVIRMLDEEHLRADIVCAGINQRIISLFSRAAASAIGYTRRIHLLTPVVIAVRQKPVTICYGCCKLVEKMSSRHCIGVLDAVDVIRRVVFSAYASEYDSTDNSIREICAVLGIPTPPDEHPADMKYRVSYTLANMLASLRTPANLELQAAACGYCI